MVYIQSRICLGNETQVKWDFEIKMDKPIQTDFVIINKK